MGTKNTFIQLFNKLRLTEELEEAEQLYTLEAWCHKHISSDIVYSNDNNTRYKRYLKLAEHYLDQFLARIHTNNNAQVSFNGLSLIQFAAYRGYHYFIEQEISEQSLNAANDAGITALHLASCQGYYHTVATLLKKNADPAKINNALQFPVFSALQRPIGFPHNLLHVKEAIFLKLIERTPQALQHQDASGATLLHLMAANGFTSLAKRFFEKNKELLFIPDKEGLYPIHIAILNQQNEIIRLFLKFKEVLFLKNKEGQTPFHYNAIYGTQESMKICYKDVSDINSRDKHQKTALILASEAKNRETFQFLIDKGADFTLADADGYTILHHAIRSQDSSFLQFILDLVKVDVSMLDPSKQLLDLRTTGDIVAILTTNYGVDIATHASPLKST